MVMKQLHPGAKWQFRVSGFFGLLFFFIFFGIWFGIVIGAALLNIFGVRSLLVFVILIPSLFIIFLILIEVYARLAYKYWKYEFTEDQLRI
jgi:MFS family permease